MKSFGLISAVFSTVVGIASAWTQPVNGPIGNPIARPGLHEKVPVGKPYTITWTPNHETGSTVTLLLLKGPSTNIIPQYAIVEKAPNSGSYVWTPDASLPDSKEGWGIQLIVDNNGDYQWSTQFGFANDGVVVDPTSTDAAATTTTTVETASTTTTEESDYPTTTTTEESDYPTTTTTVEEETTTTVPSNTTTTTVHTTTSTTTEAETTTTEVEEEPTEAPTTLTTVTLAPTNSSTQPPSNTSTVSLPTVSDSGVGKNVASFGVALVALAVAGFSLF